MEPLKSRSAFFLPLLIVALLFFSGGFLLGEHYPFTNPNNPLKLDRVIQVYNSLKSSFLLRKNLNPQKLEYGAAKGLVEAAGDPYTYFLDPKESKDFFEMINGSFQGIGAEIGFNEDNQITVIAPLEGTPAKRAGLQPQDIILQINNKLTTGLSLDEAVTLIRGPKGSSVTLMIKRSSLPDPLKLSIIRDTIEIPVVNWKPLENGSIAYIQLFNFDEKSGDRFAQAAQKILGTNAKKIILDLRGNPGGILQEAIQMAGWFVDKDAVVVSERSADGTKKDYKSEGPAQLKTFPLVILVDKGSASASEILAGALHVHNKATLVGEKTFGKGTVQVLEKFPDGSSLRVTISEWLLPDGSSINKEGIAPEILVGANSGDKKGDIQQDTQLRKAVELLK